MEAGWLEASGRAVVHALRTAGSMTWQVTWTLFGIFYATMIAAGYVIELVFQPLGLVPEQRHASVGAEGIRLNYTSVLDVVFLLLAGFLLWRFFRTGGRAMLAMMGGNPDSAHDGGR